ncbi:MAG: HAMP domain-containing sensor histidine kinase, partial [Bryobacteraceae bacterium]
TYLLARRILKPVERLDRAAGEVIKQNYDYRVPVETDDELGRLANTFNTMCDSIRTARQNLIRQERIATIGRFATSIVHDLRSPLAAIYGGAEMLVDADLSAQQSKRLAANIYRASRRIQELLQDLVDVVRAKATPRENCKLADIVHAAYELVANQAHSNSVLVKLEIPDGIKVAVERSRVERVFLNLMNNALEAMPDGGRLCLAAWRDQTEIFVQIEDTGPGLSKEAWATLFEPFASFGKRNGLGLGLALSRQTILDHGGNLWAERATVSGALFYVRLPAAISSDHPLNELAVNVEPGAE